MKEFLHALHRSIYRQKGLYRNRKTWLAAIVEMEEDLRDCCINKEISTKFMYLEDGMSIFTILIKHILQRKKSVVHPAQMLIFCLSHRSSDVY